jgi:hypothetical protein
MDATESAGMNGAGHTTTDQGTAGAAGMAGMPVMEDDGTPTWSNIYQYVFYSCKLDICHGGGLAGIQMATKQGAYDSLVNVMSDMSRPCAKLGKKRIAPGDPDNSLLYLKLDINAPCGQQMPPGGSLTDEKIARVREWIMLGAKND